MSIFFKASPAEVKRRKPACAECRKRKKRCGHRVDLPSVSEAVVPPAVAADAADAAAAANAADVPDVPAAAAAQVDAPIDDITAAHILLSMRYGTSVQEPALEGDQVSINSALVHSPFNQVQTDLYAKGRIPITSASGAESSAAAPRNPAASPGRRSQTPFRISRPSRPIPRPQAADNATMMALNTSFSRQMAKKLQDFEAKYQASLAAHQAVMEAGKAVKDLTDWWFEVWLTQQAGEEK